MNSRLKDDTGSDKHAQLSNEIQIVAKFFKINSNNNIINLFYILISHLSKQP